MQGYRRAAIMTLIALMTILVVAFGSKPADKDSFHSGVRVS
jgi:hypothetical protein